jgi:tetratricopeptide (TPR) repeat protein
VTVRPTSAIRRFARGDVDAVAAARELKTDAVLDGTVQRAGGKIRISVNLLRAGDGNSLWADSFDVPVAEVFQVEDAVSDAVVSRLRLRIEPVRMSRLRKHDTANPEAYDAFVRGMSVLGGENASGVDANREASVLFERAVTLDPGYAFAWAKLAESYVLREIFIEPEAGFFEKGQAALARAEQADPQLAENHRVRYQMAWSSRSGFDISKALGELRQARALDPGVGSEELARLYAHIGLEQAYRSALGRTAEIDPSNKALPDVRVSGLYLLGKPAEALALARQLNFDLSSNRLSLALLWEGRFEEARRAAEGELRKSPRGHDAITQRELVAAVTGERPVDEAALAKAEASARRLRTYHHTTYAIAGIRATQGDAPGAVAWLRRTVETGMPNLVLFRADPIFDRVRRAPEFQAFLADIEPVWKRYEQESAGER